MDIDVAFNIISNVLALTALVISLWTATVTVNNRSQKDFFIGEYKLIMDEYRELVVAMRTGMLSAEDIKDTLNHFSKQIRTLDEACGSLYKLPQMGILKSHGNFQYDITGLKSIEEQYNNDKVIFDADEKLDIDNKYQSVEKSILTQIVKLNGAHRVHKDHSFIVKFRKLMLRFKGRLNKYFRWFKS